VTFEVVVVLEYLGAEGALQLDLVQVVRSYMLVEVAFLGELEGAAGLRGEGTLVRSLSGVDPQVVVEVMELSKELGAAGMVALQDFQVSSGLRVAVLEDPEGARFGDDWQTGIVFLLTGLATENSGKVFLAHGVAVVNFYLVNSQGNLSSNFLMGNLVPFNHFKIFAVRIFWNQLRNSTSLQLRTGRALEQDLARFQRRKLGVLAALAGIVAGAHARRRHFLHLLRDVNVCKRKGAILSNHLSSVAGLVLGLPLDCRVEELLDAREGKAPHEVRGSVVVP